MNRFLVGTAGHIDHGKTALIRALTGIDTDRLPEEKRRGITIDLGFAHAEWDGVRISFVDVPGHERFVRNMLAGAGGIDAVLLVVAADESVMPQTREHFEIVRMLGIRRGVVAVTKTDRVAPELVGVTVSDVAELTRGSALAGSRVVAVSARTGDGLEELKRSLVALALSPGELDRASRGVRLPIDRAFTIAGFGPVVTGSLVSGTISREQKLELLPERRTVRVRRIEVHGRETPEARAGERVSVNLAGAEVAELGRGRVLASPGAFATSALVTVRIDLLPTSPPLESGDRVSFHHFSAEARASLRVLAAGRIEPGGSARAQLRLSAPLAIAPGDRFVLRRQSPVATIGGGIVLDPLAPPRARRPAALLSALLERLENGAIEDRLRLWIEEKREAGASERELAVRAGVSAAEVRSTLAAALADGRVLALRRSPDRYMAAPVLAALAVKARSEIAAYVDGGAGAVGMPRRTLTSRLLPGAEAAWTEAVESALLERGAFVAAGEEARVPGREDLPGRERELSERIADVFRQRGLSPPSPAEVSEVVQHRPRVVEGLIGYLVKRGALVRLPGGWIVSRDAVDDVVARLRASGKGGIEIAEFKEMFGLSRKLAIPLLEHLDGEKVTRRVGDRREILNG
ncbi:MAG TPA: selenocysteine-specific translation elongation factor [Thermoanaerobaculia bacterium]|nr:selenocysteine-specific translation elongation factor [Thermoanaerobaculia bacterium]